MSKKSKKILAYLMFVAALCGTPAVSEARGGSDGQVKTEKASTAQRGNFSQSFISYILKNYGFEAVKWMMLGGVGYGSAKVLDLKVLARHALGIQNADLKELMKLKRNFNQEKQKFDKKVKEFEDEKKLFEQRKTDAINNNEKLFGDKTALELKVNAFKSEVDKNKEEIDKLRNVNQNLNKELVDVKNYNAQLLNFNNEDNRKIDALLSSYLPVKIVGELAMFTDASWRQNSYDAGKVDVTPYSSNEGSVIVTSAKYDSNGVMLGDPEWLTLKADGLFDALAEKAGGGGLFNVSLKDIGLGYCGVPYLARCSYVVGDNILAFYFPVANVQLMNVENKGNGNGENANEENNNVNNEDEQNENNENDNINENENIENNENGNINENNNVNNEENNENLNENVNVNDNNVDNNNLNNEVNENNV